MLYEIKDGAECHNQSGLKEAQEPDYWCFYFPESQTGADPGSVYVNVTETVETMQQWESRFAEIEHT